MIFANKEERLRKWIGFLNETDDRKRLSAIRNLGRSGDVRVIESLVSKALQRKITSDIEACREALIDLSNPLVERTLIQRLGDSFNKIRVDAAQVLFEIGKPEWQKIILGDENDFKRLGYSDFLLSIEPLKFAMGQYDAETRKAAVKAMSAKLGDVRWKSLVTGDDDDFERLAGIDNPIGIDILILAFFGRYYETASVLTKMNSPRVKEKLIEALKGDPIKSIRKGSADVLGRMGDKHALLPLANALNDLEPDVRYAATKSIGMLGGEGSVEPLIRTLKDENYYVRQEAAEALIKLAKNDFSLLAGKWGKISGKIRTAHKDHQDGVDQSYSDCNNHKDISRHSDTGIGLEIPPELLTKISKSP